MPYYSTYAIPIPEVRVIAVIFMYNTVPAGIVVCKALSPVAFATVIAEITEVTGK